MDVFVVIMLVIAAVCFAGAAAGVVVSRVNLTALGLLVFILALLVPAIDAL